MSAELSRKEITNLVYETVRLKETGLGRALRHPRVCLRPQCCKTRLISLFFLPRMDADSSEPLKHSIH
jgi:hypothetical protein